MDICEYSILFLGRSVKQIFFGIGVFAVTEAADRGKLTRLTLRLLLVKEVLHLRLAKTEYLLSHSICRAVAFILYLEIIEYVIRNILHSNFEYLLVWKSHLKIL